MQALRNTVIANFMGLCGLTLPVAQCRHAGRRLQVLAGPWQDAPGCWPSARPYRGAPVPVRALLGEPPTP